MFWVVQKNMYSEDGFNALVTQLRRQNASHEVVDVVPFTCDTEPSLWDVADLYKNVFCVGTTALKRVSKKHGWNPGYIDENLNMSLLIQYYGQHMLNGFPDARVTSLIGNKDYLPEYFFARPMDDNKQFAGHTWKKEDFIEWCQRLVEIGENSYCTIGKTDGILIAPVRNDILSEFRFYVIDGNVVTGSMYKQGSRVYYSDKIDEYIWDYAREIVKIWQPNRAFALDIALTEEGLKVIEINSINSAGFYACDMGKFVAAINAMEF